MNTKPYHKTCYSRAVVTYHIATGTRREFPSVTRAADFVDVSSSWLGHILRTNHKAGDYIAAYVEDEEKAKERLRFYQNKREYRRDGAKTVASTRGKVALRIDSRTVIYVDKRNATEEYAEAYRRRIAGKTENNFETRNEQLNIKTKTKKRGGRR